MSAHCRGTLATASNGPDTRYLLKGERERANNGPVACYLVRSGLVKLVTCEDHGTRKVLGSTTRMKPFSA
jgi:hypothetical protein